MNHFQVQESLGDLGAWAATPETQRLLTLSPYALQVLQRHPEWGEDLATEHDWSTLETRELAQEDKDEASFYRVLRLWKHRHFVCLLYDLLNGRIDQAAFLSILSCLAEHLLEAALVFFERDLTQRYGTPLDAEGQPMRLIVLGMGKLGGRELNFSSDIDLIFAYRSAGETAQGLSYEEYFRKLARKLIASLEQVTEEGFVYRVDVRLRPFGESGPLLMHLDAMEDYYTYHGRDWERYAMMKARPVAGDIAGGDMLLKAIKPFMYRRYLDFRAYHAIAMMKEKIHAQMRMESLHHNIKLGIGGIREVEFSVQALQMIYGGQFPALQSSSLLSVLPDLVQLKLIDEARAHTLREDYLLLREVENALQFEHEQQVYALPDDEDRAAWQRLASIGGFASLEDFQKRLSLARQRVHELFDELFENDTPKDKDIELDVFDWTYFNADKMRLWLDAHGIDENTAQGIVADLQGFVQRANLSRLPSDTLERVNHLLSVLVSMMFQKNKDWSVLDELLQLIETVLRRSVYIQMLVENPPLLERAIDIAGASRWLIEFVRTHPLVLDDLLSGREHIPSREELWQDLHARVQGIDNDEEWLYALRDFKHAQVFKTAWADLNGRINLMKVSDQLTWIAEMCLQSLMQRVWAELEEKYGTPCFVDAQGQVQRCRFAIIGYGKLGGLELGYQSDLDLFFLYDQQGMEGETNGKRCLDNNVFFSRMVQRIVNYLSAPSTSGILYEVDMRLRPSGRSGLMVSALQAYQRYQREDAWTWEHQALARARFICGDALLGEEFSKLRRDILCLPRNPEGLRQDVLAMRQKMFDYAVQKGRAGKKDLFNPKTDRGGIIDIEFIVQYLLLLHAHHEPFIARLSDNIRQLSALEAAELLSSSQATVLRDTYREMRALTHAMQLHGRELEVESQLWHKKRCAIKMIWQEIFHEEIPDEAKNSKRVRAVKRDKA